MARPTIEQPAVRPQILRQYHEVTYGGRPATKEAFAGAGFDEYLALRRIAFPDMSAWRAACEAPLQELRAEAPRFSPDPPRDVVVPVTAHLARLAVLDLRKARLASGASRVIVDRVKEVCGWEGLRGCSHLDDLDVVLCGCDRGARIDPPLSVRRASIRECTGACLAVLLRGTRTRELEIVHDASPFLDLGPVAEHRRIESLTVWAPLVRGLGAVADAPLRTLRLGAVEPDADLRSLLVRVAGTLVELSLRGVRPLGPDALPRLERLVRLRVPGYSETRRAWIEFAVEHPRVACCFPAVDPPPKHQPVVSVEEIHRGVDVLRVAKGAKVTFEIAADLAAMVAQVRPSFEGDNGDLEERLKAAARSAKKKATWSSEADTLVARATSVETCRWIIDAALDG